MTALSINVNKVALIRNSREGNFPDVLEYSRACINAGAHGITAHPRPDQRHITAADCYQINDGIAREFNIEGNPFATAQASKRPDIGDYPGFMKLIEDIRPAQCTLVPDSNEQLTSDHGFDLQKSFDAVKDMVDTLKSWGVRSSLFLDPIPLQIELAAKLGADRIEFYTGPYAAAMKRGEHSSVNTFAEAASLAAQVGLDVNAGHDLNLDNLAHFAQHVKPLHEVSIGHAFTVDCLYHGLEATMTRYLAALSL